jgi:putative transposase
MIERTHPKLSVGAQCQLLSLSRSSFYYAPQGETALNLDLMRTVDKQFLDTPIYGARGRGCQCHGGIKPDSQ